MYIYVYVYILYIVQKYMTYIMAIDRALKAHFPAK